MVISQAGYVFFYSLQLFRVKADVRERLSARIPEDSFITVALEDNLARIGWEDPGKEFSLHGEMFDVVKIEKKNGKIILYCLNDKKEEQVLADLSRSVKSATDNPLGGKQGFVFSCYAVDCIIPLSDLNIACTGSDRKNYPDFTQQIVSSTLKINSPPPELCI